MASQLKLRRGTTTQHSTFTGASGEVTVDTTKKTLVVHDGTTAGGQPLLPAATGSVATTNLADSAVTTVKIANSAVSLAKMSDMATASVLGRNTAGTGAPEVLDAATARSVIGANNASNLTSGTVAPARLGTGTPSSSNFLRGDGSWQTVSSTPTTSDVLSATSGASTGAVGTYALLRSANTTTVNPGGTKAGSNLRYAHTYISTGSGNSETNGTPSGTWRCMGYDPSFVDAEPSNRQFQTLWLRIS